MNTLGDLQKVQSEVTKLLGGTAVSVKVHNGKFLSVSVINSPLKDLPKDEKRAKALEIARLSYATYGARRSLEQVGVVFVDHRTYLLVFQVTDATDSMAFSAAECAPAGATGPGDLGSPGNPPVTPLEPVGATGG